MSSGLCALCLGGPAERSVPGYGVPCCNRCWHAANDGWPKEHEATLLQALGRGGLLIPDRTPKGLLPRLYAPPEDYAL